ncbi:MAG: 16S rRNA (adenine(1518)-N(6)/adenine(1519)-N(6))-dimethyltransferase RsmA [Deltaproteobacteria bacterium]|nr:16S rRNA (adenine(1518)-N(6)/adenine(1519)-N(6))-dimethyltransferase RsmA [Deltaproteobacteria bacterium]
MKKVTVAKLLKSYSIRPNKKLGQNFLSDQNILNKLIDALDLYPDEDVLEIGSGLGVLSYHIAKHGQRILAVEKDKRLIKIAEEEFTDQPNLKFVEADFLRLDLKELLNRYHVPIKVIGNIPYYISSKIIFTLVENAPLFSLAVLTVQKEVAERMVSEPGSKDYGILSILLNSQVRVEKLFDVEPGSFMPAPEVTSSAVRITFPTAPLFEIHNRELFKKMVKTAFNQRRKTVRNTLKIMLKNNRIKPWEACGIDPELRPEQISIPQYVALANFLNPLL